MTHGVYCSAYDEKTYLSPGVRKPTFCICENKDAISFAVIPKLISAFVFVTWTVKSLYFLNLKFPAISHLGCTAWFVSDLVRIQLLVFSRWGSFYMPVNYNLQFSYLHKPPVWKGYMLTSS